MSHGKLSDFVSISLFPFTLVIKLRYLDLESKVIRILEYFFTKADMVSHLNMFHGKMSDFVSFLLFEFILVIKLKNFDFEGQ